MLATGAQAQVPTYDAATETITFGADANPYERWQLNANGTLVQGPLADSAGFKTFKDGALTIDIEDGATVQPDQINSSESTDSIQIFGENATDVTLNNDGFISNNLDFVDNQAFTWNDPDSDTNFTLNNTGRIIAVDQAFRINATEDSTAIYNNSGTISSDGSQQGQTPEKSVAIDGRGDSSFSADQRDIVVNESDGIIVGRYIGVALGNNDDSVDNSGEIRGNTVVAISLGDGNDEAILREGSRTTGGVHGDDGNDTITVAGRVSDGFSGSRGDVLGGTGNDTITVTSTAEISGNLAGGDGNDTITFEEAARGLGGSLTGNAGDDTIIIETRSIVDSDVDGGADNDTIILRGGTRGNILGQAGNDTIVIDGLIASARGVFGGDGEDTFVLRESFVMPIVVGGADGDTATVESTFNMGRLTTLDGSGDAIIGGGADDRLFLDGQIYYSETATFAPTNWQFITLRDATEYRLRDLDVLTTGLLTTQEGTFFGFQGGVSLTDGGSLGSLLNNGRTSSANGRTGDVLTIGGDFTGTGVLELDAALDETEASDFVVVGGTTTSGNTQVILVNDVGTGVGADTGDGAGNGIKLVDVSATGETQDGDFALANGPIQVGVFTYDLDLETDDIWYLQSTGKVVDPGIVIPGVPVQIKTYGRETIGTYYERTGTRIGCRADGNHTYAQGSSADLLVDTPEITAIVEEEACTYGVWARVLGAWSDAEGEIINGGVNASYDETVWAIQGGVDGIFAESDSGYFVASAFLQYGQIDSTTTDKDTGLYSGSADADAFGGGGSLTFNSYNGLYADGVATYTRYNLDIATQSGDNGSTNADSWAFSGELGWRLPVGDQFAITPQGQLIYQAISVDDFVTTDGLATSVSQADSLEGRLGATFEFVPDMGDSVARLYAEANVVHEFLDTPVTTIAGTPLFYDFEETSYEVGLGAEWGSKGKGLAVWAEGDYRAPFSGDGLNTWSATGGIAYRF